MRSQFRPASEFVFAIGIILLILGGIVSISTADHGGTLSAGSTILACGITAGLCFVSAAIVYHADKTKPSQTSLDAQEKADPR